MPTRNINLTEWLDRFVEKGVNSGKYGNASEVVRDALRLLAERQREEQAKLEWLRAAVKEGMDQLDRGEGIVIWSEKELKALIRQAGKAASAELATERRRG